MPQLDPSSFVSQIFWLLLCFISLYLIVSTFFTPAMDKVLYERQNIIDTHIDKAKDFKENANKLFEQYEDAIDEAHEQANKNSEKALAELKTFMEEKTTSLQRELSEYTAEMQETVKKEKDKALTEVSKATNDLAINIAAKIGLQKLSKENFES